MASGKRSKRRAADVGSTSEETAAETEAEATTDETDAVPMTADPVADARTEQRQKQILALVGALAVLGVIVAVVLLSQNNGGSDSANTDLSVKPVIDVPSGPPPKQLETKDIVVGDGPTAEPGDQVTVKYVGVTYDDGKEFDSSWSRNQPFPFQLGSGQVIPGWDKGVAGMKVGGRRELIIPAEDAYGAQGSPPSIGPNQALIFVVDLTDVQPPSAGAAGATSVPPTGG